MTWITWFIQIGYILELPPTQDSSDHQDYEPFLIGDPYKPSFVTITGRGVRPKLYHKSSKDWVTKPLPNGHEFMDYFHGVVILTNHVSRGHVVLGA